MIADNILKILFICFLYKNGLATVENLALKKPVYMNGFYPIYPASNAVDGNYSSLAHSLEGTNWMVVDLGGFYRVQYVKMYNVNGYAGQGLGLASRMNKFSVGLLSNYVNGTSPDVNDKCGTYPNDTVSGGIYTVNCTQPFVRYRYVVLFSNYQPDKTINTIEFEVYGDNIISYMDRYMGCYQNFPLSSNNQGDVTMLYQCLEKCKNYFYAGVTNGKDCYCSNMLGNLVLSDQCTARCSNDDHVCGSAGYFTVYNVSQCSATNTNTIACNKRDCTVNNGQCGTNLCKLNVIGPSNISECVCKSGFNKRFYNDDCRDINECLNNPNPCNTNTSTCGNTEGSFKCNCNTGYENTDEKHCTDVDECSSTTHACNIYNETCINTIGSFSCQCKDGFKLNYTTNNCDAISSSSNEKNIMVAFIIISVLLFLTVIALVVYIIRQKLIIKNLALLAFKNKEANLSMQQSTNQQHKNHFTDKIHNEETYSSIDGTNDVDANNYDHLNSVRDNDETKYQELRKSNRDNIFENKKQ